MVDEDYGAAIVESLKNHDCYNHPVERIEVLETHISWVLLTGRYAYKIKKPVNFGFLDFSTLEKRRRFCEEELRLNSRLAPDLYLEVTPVTGSIENPKIGGEGKAIEYAVKMKEFPQEAQLNRMMIKGLVTSGMIDEIALYISRFHQSVRAAPAKSPFGTPETILNAALGNFSLLKELVKQSEDLELIEEIEKWSAREHKARIGSFIKRKKEGFIRECHGDIYLGNMALIGGEVTIFDCIEFNEYFHWIDVINDAGFLVMDLQDHKRFDLARRFLNNYLEATGDYSSLSVLRFYLSYRAMVRVKVAVIKMNEPKMRAQAKKRIWIEYRGYLALARRYMHDPKPTLIITHGVSGSGKTTYTQSIVERVGAVRIRSDVERKRLFGLNPLDKSNSQPGENIYSKAANEKTYRRLASLAITIIKAGYSVVIDASFLKRNDRKMFYDLSKRVNVPFSILDFKVDEQQLRSRIMAREKAANDPSEATVKIMEKQLQSDEELTNEEMKFVTTIQ
ncbi:hypothetical protein MNBD_NITROSPINAE02-1020 [hydrothermal vent metagenome]|uniref:Uncharacterized protein n=1 Tax=hydrothermal vent metagenome TaxID=652676 RepID=A0A3B1C0V4_9ZZZZ